MSQTTIRIDPHVHSEASYDGHDPVELLLEQAAEIGLDGIVVTDHDVIHESLRAAELAPEYGLLGIPGVEVSTEVGHLLAIGVTEMPPRRAPLDETVAWVRDHGGVAVVPHPFQRSRHGVPRRHLVDCDAIEVFNSWLFTGFRNRRARRFAAEHGYPALAASDAHSVPHVGRAYTELAMSGVDRAALDGEAVLDTLRSGEMRMRGRRQPIPASARHYAIGSARKSGYYAKAGALKGRAAARAGVVRGAQLLADLSLR
ncbi:CehA/McbA family metallohydrolase [Haloplanus litoreus]|uniref:CehA/McbA family metallohydrolase n=1 Tax=Haloplanus litoreus TaxID=767515 RepID=A0ABD5ZWX0_9EURY